MSDTLEDFRHSTRLWLEKNCPTSMCGVTILSDIAYGGKKAQYDNSEKKAWLTMMAERGWTVPDWPKEYGGAGLNADEVKILKQEMSQLSCHPPLTGHGIWMLGPALLEFGSHEQKLEHLPKIAQGKIRWCQGYSEPGAGSDLADVRCKAQDMGDHYLVNGSKTWTTNADMADWIFCLVRTDPDVKKQQGISFLLIDMDNPGVTTKPIKLISGDSDFCETFFDDVKVPKQNLVGELNKGWTIAKGLLIHERSMMSDLQAFMPKPKYTAQQIIEKQLKKMGNTSEAIVFRDRLTQLNMDVAALAMTQKRIFEETKTKQFSAAALTLKYYGTEMDKRRNELVVAVLGNAGLGWEGEIFHDYELEAARQLLMSKGLSIGGGTSEIQLNIIAKVVLGLSN